jgi:hypothetical protein
MSISCDNLLCDALGRSPSAKIVISVKSNCNNKTASTTASAASLTWLKYGQTEVAEVLHLAADAQWVESPSKSSKKLLTLTKTIKNL